MAGERSIIIFESHKYLALRGKNGKGDGKKKVEEVFSSAEEVDAKGLEAGWGTTGLSKENICFVKGHYIPTGGNVVKTFIHDMKWNSGLSALGKVVHCTPKHAGRIKPLKQGMGISVIYGEHHGREI